FRLGDFFVQPRQIPSRHGPQPGLLPHADRERQLPSRFTEFKGEVQNARSCGNLAVVGRCHVQAPWKKLGFTCYLELNTSDPPSRSAQPPCLIVSLLCSAAAGKCPLK